MRELKFRAWDEEVKHMYYPPNRHLYMTMCGVVLNMQNGVHLLPLFSTGLTDSTGAEIFEADIISYGETNYIVRWNFSRWIMFDPEFDSHDSFGMPLVGPSFSRQKMKQIKIIGNIHENPSLIDGK